MSTAPATPKTSAVCAGDRPTDSAQSGTSASRIDRAPATNSAPEPRVSSTCRCRSRTEATDSWRGRGAPVAPRAPASLRAVMSGANQTSTKAARLATAPTAYAEPVPHRTIAKEPMKGPRK